MDWLKVHLRVTLLVAACLGTMPAAAQDEPAAETGAAAEETEGNESSTDEATGADPAEMPGDITARKLTPVSVSGDGSIVKKAEPLPTADTAESAEPSTNASNAATAAATGSAATTANMSAGVTSYDAVLQAWLQDHMRYPRRAKLRNMQGTAMLWLYIDAEGHVLDFRIQQSSGHSLLDSEVEELVRRADPMPPVTETMQDSSIEFVVPVQFVLR